MNKNVVAKFGGTSVANFESICQCADIISNSQNHIKVVVVSAQSKITNILVSITKNINDNDFIKQQLESAESIISSILANISNNHTRGTIDSLFDDLRLVISVRQKFNSFTLNDEIVSFGEQISSVLVAAVFNQKGIDSLCFDSRKILKTNSEFGNATPDIKEIKVAALDTLEPLVKDKVVICGGFIGSDKNNQTTTLGRGGSDYSAALIAEALNVDRLEIWTDVDGIYETDPRIISSAKPLKQMTYNEAAELSTFGAKVLHHKTLWPVVRSEIELFIGSTFKSENKGTLIIKDTKEKPTVRAIAERKNQILLTIRNLDMIHTQGFLVKVFEIFAKHQISIDLVTTSEISIAVTLDYIGSHTIEQHILSQELLNDLESLGEVKVDTDLSLIAIVGNNIHSTKSISARVFSQLADYNIRLFTHGASGHNICFLIDKDDSQAVIKNIYNSFF